MRFCPVCCAEKADVCFAGSTCTRCLGLTARRLRDQARGLKIRKQLLRDAEGIYPLNHTGQSVITPLSFFEEWCREMHNYLPTQWDSL